MLSIRRVVATLAHQRLNRRMKSDETKARHDFLVDIGNTSIGVFERVAKLCRRVA